MSAGHAWLTVLDFFFHILVFVPLLRLSRVYQWILERVFSHVRPIQPDRVQVRRILWQRYIRYFPGDYLQAIHAFARYEDARSFAWDDPNVHLFHMSEEGATFVRTRAGMNPYSSDVTAFACLAFPENALEFGVLSLDQFRRLGEERMKSLKDEEDASKKKVVMLGSHARCGGSLVTFCFEDVPNCLAINDHAIFINLTQLILQNPERADLVKTAIFFLCKQLYSWPGIDTLAVKIFIWFPMLLVDIMEASPDLPFRLKYLFVHRRPVPAMSSWMKFITEYATDGWAWANKIPFVGRLLWPDLGGTEIGYEFPHFIAAAFKRGFFQIHGTADEADWEDRFGWISRIDFISCGKKFLTSKNGSTGPDAAPLELGSFSLISHFFVAFVVPMLTLKELMNDDKFKKRILPISYEDFMTQPDSWSKKILPFCELEAGSSCDSKGAPIALTRDSQRKSAYSRARLARHRTKLNVEDLATMDTLLQNAGLKQFCCGPV